MRTGAALFDRIDRKGFTLFEVSVALLIVAFLLGTAIISIDSLSGADLKNAVRRMIGTVKSLRDEAALRSATVRLVMNLDDNTYYAEYTDEPFGLFPDKMVIEEGSAVESDEEKSYEEELRDFEENQESQGETVNIPTGGMGIFGNLLQGLDPAKVDRLKPPVFKPLEGLLSKPKRLPGNTSFSGYWVNHQDGLAEHGEAYLYFFENGMTESAMIYLEDDSGRVFSLRVHPLTGDVTPTEGKEELPQEQEEEE
ncbi:MAG: type II secretion system protein [Deltaproteobacteria bacterium]|nr:type II secretion system protein [Deltaproteobacteria bacterium]